jgi:SagB-type dehydrogenase family enzyme
MRVRRATSLIYYPSDEAGVIVFNFLTGNGFSCDIETLKLLSLLTDWTDIELLVASYRDFDPSSVLDQIRMLLELTAIVGDSSVLADQDQEYKKNWEWGLLAGFYHFGVRNTDWSTRDEAQAFLRSRVKEKESPKLFSEHPFDLAIALPAIDPTGSLSSIMDARRSRRLFFDRAISLKGLAGCLFAGFGIVGFLEDPILGKVPFKWAPSPGARNTYEAYVYVRRVDQLDPGLYHYAGYTHTLMALGRRGSPSIGTLLANQDNLNDAAAIIFLVAHFDRPMWKYPHPNGYRAVLIEAGHIAQNILLFATQQGIAALPTCASNDKVVASFLTLNPAKQAQIHAIVLGIADDGVAVNDEGSGVYRDASIRAER